MTIRHITTSLAAAVLSATLLVTACGQPTERAASQARSRTTGRPSRAAQGAVMETVDLASLLSEIPEYGGSGRNLFDFGRQPVVAPPRRETPPPPPPPPTTSRPTLPAASTARIDLKFAGYVETKTVEGETKKYAVLLDGTEILTGAEGDLVANRYKIVQIGLESVTLGVAGSNDTQQIPLQSN
jgi:hypothetical protein